MTSQLSVNSYHGTVDRFIRSHRTRRCRSIGIWSFCLPTVHDHDAQMGIANRSEKVHRDPEALLFFFLWPLSLMTTLFSLSGYPLCFFLLLGKTLERGAERRIPVFYFRRNKNERKDYCYGPSLDDRSHNSSRLIEM